MRIIIKFNSTSPIKLPFSYNELIQGFIYANLRKDLAEFLHDKGFQFKGRSYKLFTFSRLLGSIKKEKDNFKIIPPFELVVGSPNKDMIQSLAENLLKRPDTTLGGYNLFVESINVRFAPSIQDPVKIKMLSPMTIYSTLTTGDGRKKTYYYNPMEKEFSKLAFENMYNKYTAFYKKKPAKKDFCIKSIRVKKEDEVIIRYKNFIIKGWMGTYILSGSEELLSFAYEAGVGAKNSQGFGCFEVVD